MYIQYYRAYKLTDARNGALVANLAAGASEAEFLEAMRKAPVPGEEPDIQSQPLAADPPPLPVASSSSSASSPAPAAAPAQDRNAVYEERKARMEQRRVAEEKEEREKRLARERTRRESITADPPGRSSNTTYLEQQRKRQLAAQEERQRVLRLLENDKIERRQREAKRKQALAEDHDGAPDPAAKENIPQKSPTPRPTGTETAISFRLLDGSSLKTKFPSLSLLGTDVRQWLDANRNDGDHPYSFLQILAPLPNKQLSISDENSSLADLGLSPTATLVLVPAQSYTTAYSGGGTSTETGILAKAYSMFYGAFTTVLGVGYPTRTPPAPPPPAPAPAPAAPPAPPPPLQPAPTPRAAPAPSRPSTSGGLPMSRTNSGNGRIRTLYDQRDGEARAEPDGGGRKYYNGNQVRNHPLCFVELTLTRDHSWTLNRSRRKGRGKKGRSEAGRCFFF